METVEILHYKWCLWQGNKEKIAVNHIIITSDLGDLLIYCKVEKWYVHDDKHKGIMTLGGIRTVPVKREEMEKV